jgi:hypothetical protein
MPRAQLETKEHTPRIWKRIDEVVTLILSEDKYLKNKKIKSDKIPERDGELTRHVEELYGVEGRTARTYIGEAKKIIRQISKEKRNQAYDKALRDRELLFRKAIEANEIRTALEIARDRDKIKGLYVENVHHSGEVNLKNLDLNSLTTDQLSKLKGELLKGTPTAEALLKIGVIMQ